MLTFLCNLMSIQGNGSILKGILYDYHYDHDYHSVKKRQIDGVQCRFRLDQNEEGHIKSHKVSVVQGIERSDYEIQCENRFLNRIKLDDSYFENMMFDHNYLAGTYSSEKSAMEELPTRTKRDALYDPTIETNHVNEFNHRYYPNGFHHFGKIPRTYEYPEYIHRCYYGDRNIVCVVIGGESNKYDTSNRKIDYLSENKLRWFIT